MPATILSFSEDLAALSEKIDVAVADLAKKVTTDVFTRIVGNMEAHRHPVDTGRARSGWAISIGEPAVALPPAVPAEELKARAAQRRKGLEPPPIFQEPGRPDVGAIDGTQQIFILNSLPYIEALENGHSKQAPNGMVKISLMEVEAEIATL